MFAGAYFAAAYFAGVLAIVRRHLAAGIGGSGFPPDWEERMLRQHAEADRLRREREDEERELAALFASYLL